MQEERSAFKSLMGHIPPKKLIFLDESGCNLAMRKQQAWSPRGIKALDKRPVNYGSNITVIGAISANKGPFAMRTLEGAVNAKIFSAYVREVLAPKLKKDDVVILDNLQSHHAPAVRQAIEAKGAHVLYLPPYSPDMNPIELIWGPMKRRIERASKFTAHELRAAIRAAWRSLKKIKFFPIYAACGWV